VIAALYTWQAGTYAVTFGDVLGPTVFPVIVGIPMMILSASLVVFPTGQVDWPAPQRMGGSWPRLPCSSATPWRWSRWASRWPPSR
jgi:hypothetical protein